MEFLITTIVALILPVGVVSECPRPCACAGDSVDCKSKGLDSIPRYLPLNSVVLGLSNNDISVIENNAFNNLPNLTVLSLDNNDISKIEENAFNNLPKLTVLFLDNNHISKIQENAFNNLPKLAVLSLNNNDISKIEENDFNNLPSLTGLSLMSNSISFVSGKAFVNLQQLKKLLFNMDCGDCENIPFWRWLRLDQRTGISITCNDFHGRQLSSLQQNDFTGCSGEYLCTWF